MDTNKQKQDLDDLVRRRGRIGRAAPKPVLEHFPANRCDFL